MGNELLSKRLSLCHNGEGDKKIGQIEINI
jgi:hypothetical protein